MPPPKLSRLSLLDDLHRVARARKSVKQRTYKRYGRFSLFVFYARFGPWSKVLDAARKYKPNAVIATAANSAIRSSQGQLERQRMTVAGDRANANMPFMRWTEEEIQKLWPGRVYGTIPASVRVRTDVRSI